MTNAFTIPKQALTDKERRYFNQSVTQRAGGRTKTGQGHGRRRRSRPQDQA